MKTRYKVGDVMTINPVMASSDMNIIKCAQMMKEKHVGALIIKNGEGIGIITEQDIVREVIGAEKDPSMTKLKDVMVKDVMTTNPDVDIFDALRKMKEMNIRHLPVMHEGKMIGLLTMKDILKIEPQLFEILVDRIELREEERKPLNRKSEDEGMCNICGEYTTKLMEKDGVMVCKDCMKD